MKKRLLSLAACLCMATATSATDMAKLNKDSQIMRNILETSLKQENRRGGIRIRSVSTSYLQDQGMVFEVRVNTGNTHFDFNFDGLVSDLTVVAPTAPDAPDAPGFEGDFIFSDSEFVGDIQMITESALQIAREALEDTRDRRRELRHDEREIEWEIRQFEREIRDIEFEMRHAEQERKTELHERKAELQRDKAKLQEKRKDIEAMEKKLRDEEKNVADKRKQEQQQKVKQFLANFEATIAEIMCDYGGGLRALPDAEKINFVLPDFSAVKTNRGSERLDKIYIFNVEDVKSCVAEDMNASKLLDKAVTYTF